MLFCERVIRGDDQILTLVRVIGGIEITIDADAPADFPSEANRIPIQFESVATLKAGKAAGEHKIRIEMISPSGKHSESTDQTVTVPEPENGTANLITRHTVYIKKGGIFYFDVFVDDVFGTRVPFGITVTRSPPIAEAAIDRERTSEPSSA
ncbi:MAG TPA: hypothetical protein VKD71_03635 [Gemmataceae bacterium]|nr:hypothetical protein [Gemmataceae bacterium]